MYPLSDSGTSALPPLLPFMHWPVEQSPGRTVAVFFVFFVCLFVFFCWTDSLGFLRVSTTSEREGVQDRVRKKKSMKEQKGRRQVDGQREVERVESGKMLDICEGKMG